jgi:hypothetical protein
VRQSQRPSLEEGRREGRRSRRRRSHLHAHRLRLR